MNNEKVKELKEFIQRSADLGCYYKLANCEITMLEVLEYINELEKKNDEKYKRIMELEQDLVHADEKVFYRECNVALKENEIKQQEIKQFAERLKEKCEYIRRKYSCSATVGANDIDETLKEFLNEKLF